MSLLSPQLEAFLAIVEHKTVHGAAAAIHLTQTAVTQRMRALESKLKTTLFVRTRRGMQLTPEGEGLLHYCVSIRELEGEALARITGAAVDSTVRITISGPPSYMNEYVIPQSIPLLSAYPNLLMSFEINDMEERVQLLRSGKCQFAILPREQVMPEMAYKELTPEQYVLVCSPKWSTRKLEDIIRKERIIDYDAFDQMTFNYLRQYGLINLARHDRHFANRTDAIAMMLSAECGYSVLTSNLCKPYIEKHQLITLNNGKTYENPLVLAWYHRAEPPAYFMAIMEALTSGSR